MPGFVPHCGNRSMKLTEHLTPNLVKIPLVATDKTAAITELIDLIDAAGLLSAREPLLQSVLTRENQRSTGIGRGFAIPHAKSDSVDKLVVALGRTAQPIEFKAIDGKPVSLIALLASPISATSMHIQALAKLSRLVTNASVLDKILTAPTAAELYQVITENDAEN